MKTSAEIIAYIQDYHIHAMQRPSMYASTPEAFEEIMSMMDNLRLFILDLPENEPGGITGYSLFLVNKGFGSASFCGRVKYDEGISPSFIQVVQIWSEYLASPYYHRQDVN